jgi:hypothetical protein
VVEPRLEDRGQGPHLQAHDLAVGEVVAHGPRRVRVR